MPLFKYLGVSAAKAFFENRTIRVSPPNIYNDPFELRIKFMSRHEISESFHELNIHSKGNSNNIIEYIVKDASNYLYEINSSMYDEICQNIGMACFTESEQLVPINQLMWAHYGESHHGVVLEIKSNSGLSNALSKVNYINKQPILDVDFVRQQDFFIGDLYFKSEYWSYENEHRLALPLSKCNKLVDVKDQFNNDIYVHEIGIEDIEKIYLGVNSSKDMLELALDFYNNHKIPVVKQTAQRGSFGFRPSSIFGGSYQDCIDLANLYDKYKT
jgi:hypothetical protein